MIRTKHPKDLVKVANNLIRPNIWQLVHGKDQIDEEVDRRIYRYGNTKVIVEGGNLFEKDFAVWLCLLTLAEMNDYHTYESNNLSVEIAKIMGVKNPWQNSTINPIHESFDRLLSVNIRIKSDTERGKRGTTGKFVLIEGFLDSDGHGTFSTSAYREIVHSMLFGQTALSRKSYLGLKSYIARALYKYLASQQKFYSGLGYEIRLSKLCEHISYPVSKRRSWSDIWRDSIMPAIEELKKKGLISKFQYDNIHHKTEGGILKFFPPKHEVKEHIESDTIKIIRDIVNEEKTINGKESEYNNAFQDITTFLLEYHETSLNYFIKSYAKHLLDNVKVKYINPALFKIDNTFFKEFVQQQKEDRNLQTIKEHEREELRFSQNIIPDDPRYDDY